MHTLWYFHKLNKNVATNISEMAIDWKVVYFAHFHISSYTIGH